MIHWISLFFDEYLIIDRLRTTIITAT